MSTIRLLDQEKQREVTLCSLCGVEAEYLAKTYGVSEATIRMNIVPKYSREWNDPLVEFYRQTNNRNRVINGTHLYLALKGEAVSQKDLISKAGNLLPVRDAIKENIYFPGLDKIIRSTALDNYCSQISQDGYELLLDRVFGDRDAYNLILPIFEAELYREYLRQEKFSLGQVRLKTFHKVLEKVKQGGLGMTLSKRKLIDEQLATLTPREEKVLRMRCGLEEKTALTLEQSGLDFEVSGNRVRQIESKALRKLRHPSRSRHLNFLSGFITDEEVAKYLTEREEQKQKAHYRGLLYEEIKTEVLSEIAHNPELQKELNLKNILHESELNARSVDELELCVRSANFLENAGIKTIGELKAKKPEELLKIKYCGRKTIKEITEVLALKGIKWP